MIEKFGGERYIPNPQNQEKFDTSHLSPEEKKVYDKIQELKGLLEIVAAQKTITGKATQRLEQGLKSDPTIKNDPDALPTIQMYQLYLKRFQEAVKKEGDIQAELQQIQSEVSTKIDSLEYVNGIDEKGEKMKLDDTKMSSIAPEDFFEIPEKERLQYLTKNHIDASTITQGAVSEIEISFPKDQDGKINKNLEILTTAEQLFPPEVRQLTKDGEVYQRRGLKGAFYCGEKMLQIQDGVKITNITLGDPKLLTQMGQENERKQQEFIRNNPTFQSEEYASTIQQAMERGVEDENELRFLLTGDASSIQNPNREQLQRLSTASQELKNGGYLDDSRQIGVLFQELSRILGVFGFQLGSDGKVLGVGNGLPEGLENSDKFTRFQKIALSQVGVNEFDGGADKYFNFPGSNPKLNSRGTPWCAAFVNWSLEQAGYPGSGGLSAKGFIGESGFGHVGIKVGDKLLGGNQGNKVSLVSIKKQPVGYAFPTENGLKVTKPAGDINTIPDGAIVVFDRNTKNRQFS